MARCESMVALPAGRVGQCQNFASHVVGWREVCYDHFVASWRRPDLRPNPAAENFERAGLKKTGYEIENRGVFLTAEETEKARAVFGAIFGDETHATNEVP